MDIGDKIYNLRKTSGYSQEMLAEKVNVSRQTVYKWETDYARPSHDKLVTLCKIFNVTMQYFYETENVSAVYRQMECEQYKKQSNHWIISAVIWGILFAICAFAADCLRQSAFSPNKGDDVAFIYYVDPAIVYILAVVDAIFLAMFVLSVVFAVTKRRKSVEVKRM